MEIKDLATGKVFEYGTDKHHSLRISEDGRSLYFEHLQNGDGSRFGDYRFVDDTEEKIPAETDTYKEFGAESYFNIGGFGLKELEAYKQLEEQGLLLRLPFKIGQKVHYIYESCIDGSLLIGSMIYSYSCLDFPRTYYASKAEAEEALKKMREG